MSIVASATDTLRDRVRGADVSFREIARRANISISTVRRFAEMGTGHVKTLVRIEAAIDSLNATGQPGSAPNVQ